MTEKNRYPFRCPNCGNWYTPLPDVDEECPQCVSRSHAPHHKTGIIDCHFGQASATYSEQCMAEILGQVTTTRDNAQRELDRGNLRDDTLLRVEERFSDVERSMREVPEIMHWAGVMEMPGMAGDPAVARYKDVTALEDLVKMSRRPQSDLDTLRRSISLCKEMETELGQVMAELRLAMTQLRRRASEQPQEKPIVVKRNGRKPWTTVQKAEASRRAKQAAAERKSAREPQAAGIAAEGV